MLVAIAAYCIVLAAIAATATVAGKGQNGARKRNISANAQARIVTVFLTLRVHLVLQSQLARMICWMHELTVRSLHLLTSCCPEITLSYIALGLTKRYHACWP